MAKSKPGKSVYIKREVADILQQIKDAKQEDRLLTFLSQNLEVILDVKANITVIGSDLSGNEEEKVIQLNEDQEIAIKVLNNWFSSYDRIATLSGASGTGKTFTVGHWIKQLKNVTNITFLAPTHKAKNVLMKSLFSCGLNFQVYTVAQALGKQPIIDDKGKEKFESAGRSMFFYREQLVIIDEASMVSKEDYEEIIKNAKKVLFMGDRNQLPPVEESKSLAFVGSPNYELKKVTRYSGHILSECNKLRKGVETNRIVPIESDEKQIIRLNLEEAISKATELFMSKDFENDSTFCRIVAYRNDIVERNNKLIKPKVYGTDDDYFKGLKLIASKPVVRRNTHDKRKWDIYCNTSEEVKIISDPEILEIDEDLLANMPRNCEELDGLKNVGNVIRFECLSEGGITFKALILDEKATFNKENVTEDIQNKLQKEQKLIEKTKKIIQEKDDKLMEMSDSEETRSKEELEIIEKEEDNLCKELFNLEKEIEIIEESVKKFKRALFFLNRWGDDLKDIFCSTVHKAQGSTYKHVFVELKDILTPPRNRGKKIRRPDDRPKLLYTAVSRASEKVYLID